MREELQALKEQALAELGAVTTPDELKDLRIKYLGKKGPMTEILRGMGALPAEERPKIGQIVNEVKSGNGYQCQKRGFRSSVLKSKAGK